MHGGSTVPEEVVEGIKRQKRTGSVYERREGELGGAREEEEEEEEEEEVLSCRKKERGVGKDNARKFRSKKCRRRRSVVVGQTGEKERERRERERHKLLYPTRQPSGAHSSPF